MGIKKFVMLFFMSMAFCFSYGQETLDSAEVAEVKGLIEFYEYLLNTVGSAKTSVRNKDVVIKQSFLKAFRDELVQIEDDLDADRKVVTNKDVQAYLKDVDFFFEEVSFHFDDVQLSKQETEKEKNSYKAELNCRIEGISTQGDTINTLGTRFIELNFQEETDSWKIVSVYTTKTDREKELRKWWNDLSLSWKNLFETIVPNNQDSITIDYLLEVTSIEEVHLEGGMFFLDIEPVNELRKLKVLDLSHTDVSDIAPIRNIATLQYLNLSGTVVNDLSYLKYSDQLTSLNISGSKVNDLEPLKNQKQLKEFDLSETSVINFDALSKLTSLEILNLSNTSFDSSAVLAGLKNLEEVNLSGTKVSSLDCELSKLKSIDLSGTNFSDTKQLVPFRDLKIINLNHTPISKIAPLSDLPKLTHLYCDFTAVTKEEIGLFRKLKPSVLLFVNTDQLKDWWSLLDKNWKAAFMSIGQFGEPTNEQLIQLINLDTLDLSKKKLLSGNPLSQFTRLKYLNISGNLFTELDFLLDLVDLKTLIADGLPADDIKPMRDLSKLEYVSYESKVLKDISPLFKSPSLKLLNIDGSAVDHVMIKDMFEVNPEVVVLYQTNELIQWWRNLPTSWLNFFQRGMGMQQLPNELELHALTQSKTIVIDKNYNIDDLEPILKFEKIREFRITQNPIKYVGYLQHCLTLEVLEVSHCGALEFDALNKLTKLQILNLSNTALESLKFADAFTYLKELDCSGTNIKNLKGLSSLYQLEKLNLSNTKVWTLDRIMELSELKDLTCYNTRIRSGKLDDFKVKHPDCKVTFY